MLLDTAQKPKWRVRTHAGKEEIVPSVCFVIPAPNQEAIDKAER